MTDRPIIFSAPMVRALLAGRKTQTRRLATSPLRRVEVGDRLYVREGWAVKRFEPCLPHEHEWQSLSAPTIRYLADGVELAAAAHGDRTTGRGIYHGPVEKGRPSIHMPRWASRLMLIVSQVRVEPLQAMEGAHPLESDALAEGVRRIHHGDGDYFYSAFRDEPHPKNWCDPTDAFAELWNSLHDKPGERWEDNPDVVALTFRVVRGNIDRIAA